MIVSTLQYNIELCVKQQVLFPIYPTQHCDIELTVFPPLALAMTTDRLRNARPLPWSGRLPKNSKQSRSDSNGRYSKHNNWSNPSINMGKDRISPLACPYPSRVSKQEQIHSFDPSGSDTDSGYDERPKADFKIHEPVGKHDSRAAPCTTIGNDQVQRSDTGTWPEGGKNIETESDIGNRQHPRLKENISEQSKKRTGFLELPGEIRNQIYAYAVVQDKALPLSAQPPPITGVNRQIQQESLSIFYQKNAFEYSLSNFDRKELVSYVQTHKHFRHASISVSHTLTADLLTLKTNLAAWLLAAWIGQAPMLNYGNKQDDKCEWNSHAYRVAKLFSVAEVLNRRKAGLELTREVLAVVIDLAGVCCELGTEMIR
jgi:hypothetical protein